MRYVAAASGALTRGAWAGPSAGATVQIYTRAGPPVKRGIHKT